MTKHALIVDDNPANVEVMEQLLLREGVAAVSTNSPHDVAAALDAMPSIDVIFLDLEFPSGDGYKLIEVLRADARLENVPIVAYTVHLSQQNEARDAGFHSFLGKPLNVDRFPDQLRRILSGESVWEVSQ